MLSSSENICKDIYWRIKGNKPPRLLLFLVFSFYWYLSLSGIKDSAGGAAVGTQCPLSSLLMVRNDPLGKISKFNVSQYFNLCEVNGIFIGLSSYFYLAPAQSALQ